MAWSLYSTSWRFLALALCLVSALLFIVFGMRVSRESSAAIPIAILARRVPPSAGYAIALEEVQSMFRDDPVPVSGDKSLADLVSDRQIALALAASAPIFTPPAVPLLLHELKAWGAEARLSTGKPRLRSLRSGKYVAETLLSDQLCRSRTTRTGASFLVESRYGVHVVQTGTVDALGNRGESHYGQLAMILGEAGVPLSAQVSTSVQNDNYTVRDILSDTVLRWKDDTEIEFFACAVAYWFPPHTVWINEFGDEHSIDSLMQQLVSIPYGQGSCGGVHVPIAVATILNIDRNQEILSVELREKGEAYLKRLSGNLECRLQSNRCWDTEWAGGVSKLTIYQDSTLDSITVTGHHLEWIALASASCRPRRSVIKAAIDGLSSAFESLPPHRYRTFKSVLPSTFALCA